MRLVCVFNCSPLDINCTKSKNHSKSILFKAKPQKHLQQLKFRSYFICFATVFQFLQIIISLKSTATKTNIYTPENIFTLFTWIVFGFASTYTFLGKNDGPTLEIYLNNLFQFQEKYTRSYFQVDPNFCKNSLTEFLNLSFVPMLLISCSVFPPVYVLGLHWYKPCKPSLIGYFILPECFNSQTHEVWNILHTIFAVSSKFTISLMNIWLWWFGLFGTVFIFNAFHIIGTIIFRHNIVLFWKRYKQCTYFYKDAILYRQLQILNTLSNSVQQKCLGVLISGATLFFSMNLSLVIGIVKGSNEQDFKSLMVFIHAVVINDATGGLLLLIGGMVAAYAESKQKLKCVKQLESTYKTRICRRWSRRYWASCPILKTKFGDNNFLDEGTPLKCLDFAFNLTVQFLLVATNGFIS